jgi:hypothetical protein
MESTATGLENENLNPNANTNANHSPKKFAVLLVLLHGEIISKEPIDTDITIFKMASSAPCYVNVMEGAILNDLLEYWKKDMPVLFQHAKNYEDMKGYFHNLVMQSQQDVMGEMSHDPKRPYYKGILKNANIDYVNREYESNSYYDKNFIDDEENPLLDVVLFTKDNPPQYMLRNYIQGTSISTRTTARSIRLSEIMQKLKQEGYDGLFIYDTSCSVLNIKGAQDYANPRAKRAFTRNVIRAESTKRMRLGGKLRTRKLRKLRKMRRAKTRRNKRNLKNKSKKTRKNV